MIVTWMLGMVLFVVNGLLAQTKYVDLAAKGANDGSSWYNAYNQLSAALAAAGSDTSVHEILVAEGSYSPSSKSLDVAFGIFRGGLKVLGGYPAGGGTRDIAQHPTVMEGRISGGNSRHVLVICGLSATSDSVIVDGFIIQNGSAIAVGLVSYGGTSLPRYTGGGISVVNCANGNKTVIANCQIRSNKAYCVGGPFSSYVTGLGGGVYIKAASPLIYNSAFSFNAGNTIKIRPTEPLSPTAYAYGSALCVDDGSPAIVNCVFYGNTGGANTIYSGNTVASYPMVNNGIIYGNANGIASSLGKLTVTYSIVQGGYTGTGNSSSNPMFVNAAASDFRLKTGSPAIDSGSNAVLPVGSGLDYYGGARILNTVVDMGMHEYGNPSLFGPNTICLGTSRVYPGSPEGGTYSHSNPAVTSIGTSGLFTALAAGTDTIKYMIGSATVSKVVEVAGYPIVADTKGPGSVCSGASITLSNDTPGGIWSTKSFMANVDGSGLVTGLSAGLAQIVYTVTQRGCSDSVVFLVTIRPSPSVALITSGILCIGATFHLVTFPAGGTFIHTNPDVIDLDKGVGTGITAGTDTFIYIVTDTNGCTTTKTNIVTVPPASPSPVITETGGILTSTPGASYTWYLNGILISSAISRTYKPVSNGIYTVEVQLGDYNCPETSAPFVISGLGIESVTIPDAVRLYPNPAADIVHIDAKEAVRAVLCTLDGRIVLQKNDAHELNIAALPEGVYMIRLYNNQGILLLRDKLLHLTP